MLYVRFINDRAVEISTSHQFAEGWQSRHDWSSMSAVATVAESVSQLTGEQWLAVDNGPDCSPRWDITKAPVVGAPISAAINGDCRPDGHIVSVSANFQVRTDTGHCYRRVKDTGRWKRTRSYEHMVQGHISKYNHSV